MMTTYKQGAGIGERPSDWPTILFFVLAYAIAWDALVIMGPIARQSDVGDAQTLLAMGEAFQFEGVALSVPQWFVYLLTRLADFALSIAGVVMIATRPDAPDCTNCGGAWHLPVLIGHDVLSIVAFTLLSIGPSMLFTWLFNCSGGSLILVLLFRATQNWEDGFEVLFPSLVGTEWGLASTLSLLVVSLVAGIVVWRNGRSPRPYISVKWWCD